MIRIILVNAKNLTKKCSFHSSSGIEIKNKRKTANSVAIHRIMWIEIAFQVSNKSQINKNFVLLFYISFHFILFLPSLIKISRKKIILDNFCCLSFLCYFYFCFLLQFFSLLVFVCIVLREVWERRRKTAS